MTSQRMEGEGDGSNELVEKTSEFGILAPVRKTEGADAVWKLSSYDHQQQLAKLSDERRVLMQ